MPVLQQLYSRGELCVADIRSHSASVMVLGLVICGSFKLIGGVGESIVAGIGGARKEQAHTGRIHLLLSEIALNCALARPQ